MDVRRPYIAKYMFIHIYTRMGFWIPIAPVSKSYAMTDVGRPSLMLDGDR